MCGKVEDLSDEMFAARHLRYEIYEKKQIQPLLSQRRRQNRSTTHSESEHSLTASADPRSPDMLGGGGSIAGPECVGGEPPPPVFGYDYEAQSDMAAVCLDDSCLPTLDVSLYRLSASTLAAFSQSSSAGPETGESDAAGTGVAETWPTRSFPLDDDSDCNQLELTESCRRGDCATSSSISAGLIACNIPPTEDDDTQLTSVSPTVTQSMMLR